MSTSTINIKEEELSDGKDDIRANNVDVEQSKRGKKRKKGKRGKKIPERCDFKLKAAIKEDHGKPLFGVQFNPYCGMGPDAQQVFATVGGNRVSIYECNPTGELTVLQAYVDPEADEEYYTCAWTYDMETKDPLLAFAGRQGIIRTISPTNFHQTSTLIGHGQAVNELRFSPVYPNILLSASADHAIRLWNLKTKVCVLILGGEKGHRDEVLSVDFNATATKIVSCGMDHSLKIWSLDTEAIQNAIKKSDSYDPSCGKSFRAIILHAPMFSTCAVHRNYVDCTRWIGDLVLSKSTDSKIVCWKPGGEPHLVFNDEKKSNYLGDPVTIVNRHEYAGCEIWYVRFCTDARFTKMAVGNQEGKVFIWDLETSAPNSKPSRQTLESRYCVAAVRQTSFNADGTILVLVCDDGSVWRWDLAQ
eukprot:m.70499 g.70499  ORF g.70499 m.70499 type:complete len:417 (-) comp12139_c0_seq2:1225-2475(-)